MKWMKSWSYERQLHVLVWTKTGDHPTHSIKFITKFGFDYCVSNFGREDKSDESDDKTIGERASWNALKKLSKLVVPDISRIWRG
jgi:hypothetical protein